MNFDFKKLIVPAIIVILFLGVIFGISAFRKAPKDSTTTTQQESIFTSLEPADNIESDQSAVEVKGKVKSRRDVVRVNGEKVKVDKNGAFSTTVNLNEGANDISIEAETPNKKKDQRKITVIKKNIAQEKQNQTLNQPQGDVKGSETPAPNGQAQKPSAPGTSPGAGGQGAPAPQTSPDGTTKGGQPLAEAGPKENAALALTALGFTYYFWKRSRKPLKNRA